MHLFTEAGGNPARARRRKVPANGDTSYLPESRILPEAADRGKGHWEKHAKRIHPEKAGPLAPSRNM